MVNNVYCVVKVESREYEILIRVGGRIGNSGKSGSVKWVYILIRCQSFTQTHIFFKWKAEIYFYAIGT